MLLFLFFLNVPSPRTHSFIFADHTNRTSISECREVDHLGNHAENIGKDNCVEEDDDSQP